MLREAPRKREEERNEHHRQRNNAQHNVADEDGKINGAEWPVALVERVSVQRVVDYVGD